MASRSRESSSSDFPGVPTGPSTGVLEGEPVSPQDRRSGRPDGGRSLELGQGGDAATCGMGPKPTLKAKAEEAAFGPTILLAAGAGSRAGVVSATATMAASPRGVVVAMGLEIPDPPAAEEYGAGARAARTR